MGTKYLESLWVNFEKIVVRIMLWTSYLSSFLPFLLSNSSCNTDVAVCPYQFYSLSRSL